MRIVCGVVNIPCNCVPSAHLIAHCTIPAAVLLGLIVTMTCNIMPCSSRRVWWDLLGVVPLDWLAVTALGASGALTDPMTGQQPLVLCSLLRLFHLVRALQTQHTHSTPRNGHLAWCSGCCDVQ